MPSQKTATERTAASPGKRGSNRKLRKLKIHSIDTLSIDPRLPYSAPIPSPDFWKGYFKQENTDRECNDAIVEKGPWGRTSET
jgi:hypothetical protein